MRYFAVILLAAIVAAAPLCGAANDSIPPAIRFYHEWCAMNRHIMSSSTGYVPRDCKIAFGPLSSLVGFNTLEGFRLGGGLATTAGLSRYVAVRGYGAYGFRDHRWKYMTEAEWSFRPVDGYFGAWPVNSVTARISYDTKTLGTEALTTLPQRQRFRIIRRHNEMMLYRREATVTYRFEPTRQAALALSGTRERVYPTRYIDFITAATPVPLATLDAWRLYAEAAWTPGGDFIQTSTTRYDISPHSPRLKARIGWTNGASSADATNLLTIEGAASQCIPLNSAGMRLDILAHGVVTSGNGAYPFTPSLPCSPYILRAFGHFAMLTPMELSADNYADLHMRFDDGGALFNLIPGVRLFGMSLTASVDAAAGSLSHRNNPKINHNLPAMPLNSCRNLKWDKPYAEAGIGVNRILGIMQLEYVWRLSYRDGPPSRRSGIALGMNVSF